MTIKTTALLRGSTSISSANTMEPATRMNCGRLGSIRQEAAERDREHRKPQHDADDRAGRRDRPATLDQHRWTETEDHGEADIEQTPDQARDDHSYERMTIEPPGYGDGGDKFGGGR